MKKSMKWIYMLIGGFLSVGLIAGAGFAFLKSEAASRYSLSQEGINLFSGWISDGDRPMNNYEEALAEALGITVEELKAAHEAVFQAQIEAAVSDGTLTEEQADRILNHEGFGFRGRRGPGLFGVEIVELLAEELGISVSTLEAAQAQAREKLMAAALENGDLSLEQYELMLSHQALAPYLESAIAQAFEDAVSQAFSEGAITQTQADLLLENGHPGIGTGRFPAGPGMRGFKGHFPGGRYFNSDEG